MKSLSVLLDLSVLATSTTSRGIGRYASELAVALHRQTRGNAELRILGLVSLPLWGQPRVSEDIPAVLEELRTRQSRQGKSSWASRVRLSLARAAVSTQADVVHSLDPSATPLVALGCPRVVTCHHVDSRLSTEAWHGAGAQHSRTERRRFARADRVVAISRATAQELIARLDVPREKISVVHNGADLERWSSAPRSDDGARLSALGLVGTRFLLCVGAADARKNVAGVLQGLARARKLSGQNNLMLVWAGRLEKGAHTELDEQAKKSGIPGSVVKLGYVPDGDLAALYRSAVALVFTSRREGFGYPVVEAMACGCPVITSNRSSMIEIAAEAALTVDPDDAEAIADAIVLLADDNAERRRLAKSGPERATAFSAPKMAHETLAVYQQTVVEQPAPASAPASSKRAPE